MYSLTSPSKGAPHFWREGRRILIAGSATVGVGAWLKNRREGGCIIEEQERGWVHGRRTGERVGAWFKNRSEGGACLKNRREDRRTVEEQERGWVHSWRTIERVVWG